MKKIYVAHVDNEPLFEGAEIIKVEHIDGLEFTAVQFQQDWAAAQDIVDNPKDYDAICEQLIKEGWIIEVFRVNCYVI